MSEKKTGGLAFWTPKVDDQDDLTPGMTLRDYFAAKAMQADMSDGGVPSKLADKETVARHAYDMADAMLKAREQGGV